MRIGMETWARAVNRDNARNQVQEFKPVQQPRGANGDLRSRRRERQMLGHEFEKPEDSRKSPQKNLKDPALFKKIKGRSCNGAPVLQPGLWSQEVPLFQMCKNKGVGCHHKNPHAGYF